VRNQHQFYSQYYLNLVEANKQGAADWTLEYSLTSAYGLQSPITAKKMSDLLTEMKKNDTLFDTYYKYNAVSMVNDTKCVQQCRTGQLCSMGYVDKDELHACLNPPVSSANTFQLYSKFIVVFILYVVFY
jgi:hypothetical protein